MSGQDEKKFLRGLIDELLKYPQETPWLEFKRNNSNPEDIGEYLSALSNAAALEGKNSAYLVWGIDDETHEVEGTTFNPASAKKGNEDLENWLIRLLSPRFHFRFHSFEYQGKALVLLQIPRASEKPTAFQGTEFIRVGSYRKKLKDFPEIEKELWRIFDRTPFEILLAKEHLDGSEVLSLLDYPSYFQLLGRPLPENRESILEALGEDEMIISDGAGCWNITNLGAILFARSLGDFKQLARKSIRVIVYDGRGRLKTRQEQEGKKGYASGFEGLIGFVNGLLPRNEVIEKALRKDVPMYPELAVRELVANALLHQDFSISGTGPMVEIFDDRMEITNPGAPLVKTERFLDSPPRSRNEALASFMRRIGVCEERGSGVDKVVFETEYFQLPAPKFETIEESTRAVLFAHKELNDMEKQDRVRACYLHAALRWVQGDPMTNSSLRERFGIEKRNSAIASRIIKETLDSTLIRPLDPDQGKRNAKYVPFWS